MIQKKYLCKTISEANDAIASIGKLLSETEHKSAVITFYEAGLSASDVEAMLARIKISAVRNLKLPVYRSWSLRSLCRKERVCC